jgi:hypothetical protein
MTLARAFSEVRFHNGVVDNYADGRSTRFARVFNPRLSFRLTRPLTDPQLFDLRNFYLLVARFGQPFWFYNIRETEPPGTWDPTGVDPVGRYTVVWEGPWSDTLNLGRHETSFILREVD